MKRRDLLKGLTALPAVTLGPLIIGNAEKGIAAQIDAAHVTRGKYVLFVDSAYVDVSEMTGALLPPGFDGIDCAIVPVSTKGRPIEDLVKMYKVDEKKNGVA